MGKVLKWIGIGTLALLGVLAATLLYFRWQSMQREVLSNAEARPVTGRFVETTAGAFFVQEAGPVAGPVVLLIHGTGAWSEIWRPTMAALATAGYRAIALDLPPFGFSDRPEPPAYDRQTQANGLLDLLDAMSIVQVTLVGHSFGAGATVELALLAPERIERLVLVDAALGLPAIGAETWPTAAVTTPTLLEQLLHIRPLRNTLLSATITNPLLTRPLLYTLIANRAAATAEVLTMLQEPLVLHDSTNALGEWLVPFLFAEANGMSSDPAAYATLDLPVALLWGELDQVTPLAQGEALQQRLPNATLTVLPAVGHIPALEDPAAFNRALLAQLR
ncbi:MAG: alpha/beta hydrolase [Caldilineaceae bacterium]